MGHDAPLLTRAESRSVDQRLIAAGVPGVLLMENAGRGAAECIAARASDVRRATVLVGPGNNGGDGLVVARHLALRLPAMELTVVTEGVEDWSSARSLRDLQDQKPPDPEAIRKASEALQWRLRLFEEQRRSSSETERRSTIQYDTSQHVQDLKSELQYTRETLQATIEELETSNEELQATNEELLAANEELQSTNEELQSLNEELVTVNSEHQEKINELTIVNNDIENLLQNTKLGVIFLDKVTHPEASPGPQDSFYLFERFAGAMRERRA